MDDSVNKIALKNTHFAQTRKAGKNTSQETKSANPVSLVERGRPARKTNKHAKGNYGG